MRESKFHDYIVQILTLSKPLLWSLLPRTSPIPARSVTGFSFIGSATKFLCFWDVVLILLVYFWTLTKIEFLEKNLTVWCNFTLYSNIKVTRNCSSGATVVFRMNFEIVNKMNVDDVIEHCRHENKYTSEFQNSSH